LQDAPSRQKFLLGWNYSGLRDDWYVVTWNTPGADQKCDRIGQISGRAGAAGLAGAAGA
jgi:hypothetical protein